MVESTAPHQEDPWPQVHVERKRLRQELAEFKAEIEDRLHWLFIQRMEFREDIEAARRQFVQSTAALQRQAEHKLSEYAATRGEIKRQVWDLRT